MSKQEKDAAECRNLREKDRRYMELISAASGKKQNSYAKLEKLRSTRDQLRGKLSQLRKQQALLTAGSVFSGPLGMASGLSEAGLASQVSVLEAQLEEIRREIPLVEAEARSHQDAKVHWENKLRENTMKLREFNCVI